MAVMKRPNFGYPSPPPPRGAKMSVLVRLAVGGTLLLIVALVLVQVLGR